jgi:hypothetical protein
MQLLHSVYYPGESVHNLRCLPRGESCKDFFDSKDFHRIFGGFGSFRIIPMQAAGFVGLYPIRACLAPIIWGWNQRIHL